MFIYTTVCDFLWFFIWFGVWSPWSASNESIENKMHTAILIVSIINILVKIGTIYLAIRQPKAREAPPNPNDQQKREWAEYQEQVKQETDRRLRLRGGLVPTQILANLKDFILFTPSK